MKKYLLFTVCVLLCHTKLSAQITYTITSHSLMTFSGVCTGHVVHQIYPSSYSPTLSVLTYWDDGTTATDSVHYSLGYAYPMHAYSLRSRYSVKTILFDGATPQDSVTDIFDDRNCHGSEIKLYMDNNSNCVYDSGDDLISFPMTIEVDSAGMAIDTINSSSLYYQTFGGTGTVYTFKVISSYPGLSPTCPTSGTAIITIGVDSFASIGFQCLGSTGYDASVFASVTARTQLADVRILATNSQCTSSAWKLTMTMSGKYTFAWAIPPPSSAVGNTISWDFSSTTPQFVTARFYVPGTMLHPGDTAHSSYLVTPFIGDADTTNNLIVRIDTVKTSFDPNEKEASPTGIIKSGTELNYNIRFENTGNAPAENIYVLDTLSDNVDINTFKLRGSTHPLYTIFSKDAAGHNVIEFDFPQIHLLDSSHHGQCDGMVSYAIKTKPGLADGTSIQNSAGIYFDNNAVVMTNTTENTIGTPLHTAALVHANTVSIYPNPTHDQLTITSFIDNYDQFQIANLLGETIIQQPLSDTTTKVGVKQLPSGIYFITLKGQSGVTVQKFEKL